MVHTSQKIKMIKTSDIIPNPYQTRRRFERTGLERLAASLKEVGMLSPVIVRRSSNGFELICGQRRVRAAKIAQMNEIPAIIVRAGDAQCAQISLIENIQRKNLSFFEEGEGYYNLMVYHRVKKDKLSKALSADSVRISEKVRLLGLSEKTRYKIEENLIAENTARELLRLHNEEKQLKIIEKAVSEGLSHREICHMIKQSIKDMAQNGEKEIRQRIKISSPEEKLSIYINTVKKTVELLKKSGAKVELSQNEAENYSEFVIKIAK